MPDKSADLLGEVIKLAMALPDNPVAYGELSSSRRRMVRADLETAATRLSALAQAFNDVRQPKRVFDPTSPKVIGEVVARALLDQGRDTLENSVKEPF